MDFVKPTAQSKAVNITEQDKTTKTIGADVTPYSHYTNDELLNIVYINDKSTPLELELAFRLENNYASEVSADFEEPVVQDFENVRRSG